jgi:hypothetical protein
LKIRSQKIAEIGHCNKYLHIRKLFLLGSFKTESENETTHEIHKLKDDILEPKFFG